MPRLLIKDAHEWTNEISSVPTIWRTAVKGTDLKLSAGKEDPVEFDSSLTLCSDIGGVVIGGRFTNNEIPLLLSSLYLSNDGGTAAASSEVRVLSDFETRSFSDSSDKRASARPLVWSTSQVGSLAGRRATLTKASKSRT